MDRLEIEIVLAMPQRQYRQSMEVPSDTTAREAVKIALDQGWLAAADVDIDPLLAPLGVFGELVEDSQTLAAGDRVEIYRPLHQDPKDLRRQRARQGKG